MSNTTKKGEEIFWFDVDVFQDALDDYVGGMRKIVKQAIYSTVARLRAHAVTTLSDRIREKWNISKRDLDVYLRVRIGNRGEAYDSFEMTIKGATLSLSKFKVRQTSGNRVSTTRSSRVLRRQGNDQGVSVEVIKGKRKLLKRSWLHVKGTHVMVLTRKGKSRTPIALRVVVSPASIYTNDQYHEWFTDHVMAFIEKEFDRQLTYRLQQAGYL